MRTSIYWCELLTVDVGLLLLDANNLSSTELLDSSFLIDVGHQIEWDAGSVSPHSNFPSVFELTHTATLNFCPSLRCL